MGEAVSMRMGKSPGDLLADDQGLGDGHRPAHEARFEGMALDELEHRRAQCSRAFEAMYRRDVGVAERGEQAGLALEASQSFGVGGEAAGSTLMATVRPSEWSWAR